MEEPRKGLEQGRVVWQNKPARLQVWRAVFWNGLWEGLFLDPCCPPHKAFTVYEQVFYLSDSLGLLVAVRQSIRYYSGNTVGTGVCQDIDVP